MFGVLLAILALDAVILGAAVLLQAGQGGGLASLGGGSGTEMIMGGRQAVTLLTKVTWWTGGIFLGLGLILAVMSAHGGAPRSVLEGSVPPPATQPAPLPIQTQPATPQQQPPTTPPPNR
jgi:preprotein translocase subunit SecG